MKIAIFMKRQKLTKRQVDRCLKFMLGIISRRPFIWHHMESSFLILKLPLVALGLSKPKCCSVRHLLTPVSLLTFRYSYQNVIHTST